MKERQREEEEEEERKKKKKKRKEERLVLESKKQQSDKEEWNRLEKTVSGFEFFFIFILVVFLGLILKQKLNFVIGI